VNTSERRDDKLRSSAKLYRLATKAAEFRFVGRTFLSTYDIARVAAIQARVVRLVVFSSQRG